MTREEAKLKVWKAHCNFYDPRKAMNIVIDKIFNDHEAQLEALQQHKNCDGCIYVRGIYLPNPCFECFRFAQLKDKYEAKEQ